MFRRWLLLALVLAIVPPGPLRAATAENRVTFDQVMTKWTVEANGTWVVDADLTIRAPKDNVSHVVKVPMTWSESVEKLEVIQARIDKPDGHSIVMGKEAIREDPPTGDMYFHEYSDIRRLIITFTNTETGDLLVIRSHRVVSHPLVPGGFMAAPVLDRGVGWEETNYTVSVPADVPFHFETREFDHQDELIKDRVMHYFHSPKVVAPAREVTVLGQFDRLPRFAVSTFRDWDAFGKAYASVLLPHAKATPAIAAFAAKLTEGQEDQQEQARLLYGWVRDNIRHIPIPLEESKPAPHDAEQILTNRYGDDKDHVVLLYALLAARGIAAEFVLLNSSDDGTIADPPNLRPMNHLILFLPKFKTYVDSTLRVAPFGILAFGEIGKPAIHLGGSGLAHRDIPMPPSNATLSEMKTDMTMGADGQVTGTTTTTARGAFGIWLRNTARTVGEHNPGAAVVLLRQHGTPGSGLFSFDPPTSPGDDYTVRGTFKLDDQSGLLRGGFFALWTGLRILPRPGDVLAGPMFIPDLRANQPTFCYPGVQSEELSLTIPEDRELGALPEDIKIDTDHVRYRAHWALDGTRVTVSREFQSLAPGPICSGEVREEMAGVLTKVRADMVNPMGFRQDKAVAEHASAPQPAAKQ